MVRPYCGGCGSPIDYATGPLEWVETAENGGYWRLPQGCVAEIVRECPACGIEDDSAGVAVEMCDEPPKQED